QKVATSEHGQTAYSTIERYDARGRLLQVVEPEGGAEARYTYDVADRLRVATIRPRGGVATQTRRWDYDGRGFLLSEAHPESGKTIYSDHDARGRAHRIEDGTSDLLYSYDAFERLVEVREADSDRPWQSFVYGTSGRSTNRLIEAIGHNWIRIPWAPSLLTDVAVTERYSHDGPGGAVSRKTTAVSGGQRFTQAWSYDALGSVTELTYPRCTHAACAGTGSEPSSAQTRHYSRGYLASIPGLLNGMSYDVSGMATRIDHASGLRVDVVPDASGLPRPRDIRASWPAGWPGAAEESKNLLPTDDPLFVAQGVAVLGAHRYDGSGNVRARGSEWYSFDGANRLRSFNLGSGSTQAYRFDGFGNLNRITTDGVHRTLPILAASNRLAAGQYDAVGNLTAWGSETYGFDVLDRMQARNFPERTHIFTVDGERLFTFDWDPQSGQITERWTLRDLDGSVLTTYETDGGNAGAWRWTQDYVYRGSTMLASRVRFDDGSIGVRDYVVDHLGTPRLIGDRFDGLRTQHFFGFGEPIDLAASRSDPERKRFTGHERDLGTRAGTGGVQIELDSMRARFCSPWTARFLSVDPAPESVNAKIPQTWNRYSYTFNNPISLIDPDGRAVETPWDATNVALGFASFVKNVAVGNVPGAAIDAVGITLDVAATATPAVPGGAASSIRAARLAANVRFGKAFEKAVLNAVAFNKNNRQLTIRGSSRKFRIPDGLENGVLLEIKGVKELSLTSQVRDFVKFAGSSGRTVVLAVTDKTKVSRSFNELIEQGKVVIVRFKPE
ncbi:MAG: putative toxin, partial [Acidobacteriota bacterium]